MIHASGCPVITFASVFVHIVDSVWKVIILELIIGLLLALQGNRFFPDFIGTFYGIVAYISSLFIMFAYSTINSLVDVLCPFVYAFLIAIAIGKVAGFHPKLATGGIGGISFLVVGLLVFNIFVGMIFAALGGYLAWRWGDRVVIIVTSIIGSALVMGAISLTIQGEPSDQRTAAMFTSQSVEINWTFYIYILLFIVCLFFSIRFQWKNIGSYEKSKQPYHNKENSKTNEEKSEENREAILDALLGLP